MRYLVTFLTPEMKYLHFTPEIKLVTWGQSLLDTTMDPD